MHAFSGENFIIFSLNPSLTLPFFSSFYHRGICQIFTNTFKQQMKKKLNLIHYIKALILKSLGILNCDFSASPRIKVEKKKSTPKAKTNPNDMRCSTLIKIAPKQALCTSQISSTYFCICLQFLTLVFTHKKEVSYRVLTARICDTQFGINTAYHIDTTQMCQKFFIVHIFRERCIYLYSIILFYSIL